MKVWLTADHHFHHANLLRFQDRDGAYFRGARFATVEEMDEEMVSRWNARVSPGDKVYHLGDIVMGDSARNHEIVRRLNGRKVLIKGNHDTAKLKVYAEHFKDVRGTHLLETGQWPCTHLVLGHIPINQFSLRRGWVQAHGHTHEKGSPKGPYVSVCVEKHDYYPLEFGDVVKLAHEAIRMYGTINDGGSERDLRTSLDISHLDTTANEDAGSDEPLCRTGSEQILSEV